MPQRKSKKILIYFFLFISIGTLSHKDFYDNTYPPYKVVDTKTNEIVRVIEEN